jgi:hypothetical protein
MFLLQFQEVCTLYSECGYTAYKCSVVVSGFEYSMNFFAVLQNVQKCHLFFVECDIT